MYYYIRTYTGFQTDCKPRASPQAELRPGRLPTSRITTREAHHKHNYDQGAYPQAERPGTWLTGWLAELRPGNLSCAWFGGLAGWWAEAHRGPERPREAQRGGAWIEQACHALGWRLPTSRFTTREAPHRFLSGTPEEAPADYIHMYHYIHTYIHRVPNRNPLQTQGLPTSRITTREAHVCMYVCTYSNQEKRYLLDVCMSPTRSRKTCALSKVVDTNLSCVIVSSGVSSDSSGRLDAG